MAAVRENDTRYRDLVENAGDIILAVDLDDRFTSVNAAFERVLGYPRDEIVGQPIESVVAPQWASQVRDATSAKLRRPGEATYYDVELLARDGRPVPVEVASWLVLEDGQPAGVQAICRDMRERHAAEEALREAQEALRTREDLFERAFEDTVVGLMVVAPDGGIERANPAFCRLLGYSAAELTARTVVDITHVDDRGETRKSLAGLFAGGLRRYRNEKRYVRKDGEVVRVQLGVSPVRDADGRVQSVVAQVLDVTARRDAEDALHDRERLFRAAFDDAATGMLMTSAEGTILRANRAFAELVGRDADELVGVDPIAITRPDDRAASLEVRGCDRNQPVKLEKRYLRPDGTSVWVEVAMSPVLGEDGRPTCFVTQVVDLTERRLSEERFRRLFEASPQGMAVVDRHGRLLEANAALGHILGYDAAELAGRHFAEFTHPEDQAADVDLYGELMTGRRAHYELEKRFLRRNGGLVWGHVTVFALPDPTGRRKLAIGVVGDVTERRELEDQLRQVQRIEAIGQLAGGVAHDFNNVLTAVASYCDLAEAALPRGEDPTVRASIDGIRSAAGRAADMTQQLLAFGRRQVLELAPIDLNAAIRAQAQLLERLLGDDVEMRLSLDGALDAVTMDAGQLGQVVMNLAVNARDSMPDGGVLTIETMNVELDRAPTTTGVISGSFVLLAVSDTGCGMSAETLEHVFEPFFTTKEQGKGTGLGLSTVLGIVEQSGGRVSIYSEPGVGTSVKVYMPNSGRVPRPAFPPALSTAAKRPAGTGRILLVEDNEAVRLPVACLLSELGYDVVEADGPESALQLAAETELDLLVTDVVMPSMNGRQLAERLLEAQPDLKVLYMSGYTDDAVIARGVIEPGTAFLQKPFGADGLARKIGELLG